MNLECNDLVYKETIKPGVFPKTRYQGSKYRLTKWIADSLFDLKFDSVLDAFSGTASVAYTFKSMGKSVIANDKMKFNMQVSKAFIENNSVIVDENDFLFVLKKDPGFKYKSTITDTFEGIYYTNEENIWLDIITQNINRISNEYKKAILFWALFQSCLSKRPYNLFHRSNLKIRTSDVKRSFGNKSTWDKPFDTHFINFIKQANNAIFDNNKKNKSICDDVANLDPKKIKADLVYFDPPYIPKKGSLTMYIDFYHFLEGLTSYNNWPSKIDFNSKNRTFFKEKSPWEDKKLISNELFMCIEKFKDSKIAISYRNDGIPTIEEIVSFLQSIGKKVNINYMDYKYVLSKKTNIKEVLIIGV